MKNTQREYTVSRRGFTVRDLAVALSCLLVAGSLLVTLTGATRDLSQAQVCADHLRQLFAGMTAYVNQYSSYPPNAPWPLYMAPETIGGVNTVGWDPNIGFIMTHGLGLEPPARDTPTGHFKWYGTPLDQLPDVCKCPSLPPVLLDPTYPELDIGSGQPAPLETVLYHYALSYQTSGTCRAACTIRTPRTASTSGQGGRNPPIPDPTSSSSSRPYDNSQRGNPYVWVLQHKQGVPASDPSDSGQELNCYIQAIHPAEVQSPGRTYYLADSRDYRPQPKGTSYSWPAAGTYNGWMVGLGNQIFQGTRHFGWANVMYLDGRVTRDNQYHNPQWNLDYDSFTQQGRSTQWRVCAFASDIRIANIRRQWPVMPVLMVKGWEYFFDAGGLNAR